jgi:hypothetical protein
LKNSDRFWNAPKLLVDQHGRSPVSLARRYSGNSDNRLRCWMHLCIAAIDIQRP